MYQIQQIALHSTGVFLLRYSHLHENCALLGSHAPSNGYFLPKFRNNLSVPSPGFKNLTDSRTLVMTPICCPETSVINYHYSVRNNAENVSSQLLQGGSLKSHPEITHFYLHVSAGKSGHLQFRDAQHIT